MNQLARQLRRAGRLPFLCALLLAAVLGGAVRPAQAAGTYTVTNRFDDGRDGTLRSAISLANADPGATVVFAPDVSGGIYLQGTELDVAAPMTILGPGAGVVQIDGSGAQRLFNITSPSAQVTISGLTLQNGSAFNDPDALTEGVGGAIYNGGALTLTGCTLYNNAAAYGGAIYNGGALALTGCTFIYNAAFGGGGGGLYDVGTSTLTGCSCLGNNAAYGAALYSGGAMTLTACTVSGNNAVADDSGNSGVGAGLYNDGALTLAACVVSGNRAYGGSADNGGDGGSGAGLYSDGTLSLTGCTVSGNSTGPNADGSGGMGAGLDNRGAATLTDDIFYADRAASAPEIANDTLDSPGATVTASYSDIQGSRVAPSDFGPTNLYGPTDLDADPLFVRPVGSAGPSDFGDLHLQAGSPVIGQGIADPSDAADRDGSPRPDPPGIGAYEYASGQATGFWTPLARPAPEPIGTMLLLTDGTVMGQGTAPGGAGVGMGDADWFRLTPDAQGSYANGTWTPMAPMHTPRTGYASAVLRSGRVLVAGGKYTDSGTIVDTSQTEIYDPVADAWAAIAGPPGWANIGDPPSKTLADGTVLLGTLYETRTAIFDETTGGWTENGNKPDVSAGQKWALLPDQSVLTLVNHTDAEKYLPASDAWVSAGQTPTDLVQNGSGESGPGVLLPGGQCWFIGATGHTALYAPPSDPAQPGTWQAGPDFPADPGGSPLAATAAPACLMVNGKVLCVVSPGGNDFSTLGPQSFFEYSPDASGGTLAPAPAPGINPAFPARTGRMLALPSGQVLYSSLSAQLAVYTPSGGPSPAWRPTVAGGSMNPDGSFQVFGTQFNGLSEGAYYGDDASMSSNYPLVRLTDGSGVVTYARTFNHSTMGVATGGLPVSTNFALPPAGAYQLQVVANGIASDPVGVTVPLALASLSVPTPTAGGAAVTGTVTLNGPAPTDTVVGLSSSDSSAVRVHRAVVIPAGSRSAAFTINTYPSRAGRTVTIQAALGPVALTAPLAIN